MKRIIIKWLFKLLDPVPRRKLDNEKISETLLNLYADDGFNQYIYARDLNLLQSMGSGVSPTEYNILLGQRAELNKFLNDVKIAFEKYDKKKK